MARRSPRSAAALMDASTADPADRNEPRRPPAAAEWLTPEQVSAMIGVSVQTLASWRHTGKRGPAWSRPLPRVVRYRRADVEHWLASATVSSTAEADARDRQYASA
jgi:hypothetical protein